MSLRLAILGFLDLEPTTGYTLAQRFSGSVGSFWSSTQSQIYRELHELEREQLAQVEVVPQPGKPPRKVYSLTALGHSQLAQLLAAPSEALVLRDPFLLTFVFSAGTPPEQLDGALERHAAELEARRQEYQARLTAPYIFELARSEREALVWRLSLENGSSWCEAQLAWVAQARRELAVSRAAHGSSSAFGAQAKAGTQAKAGAQTKTKAKPTSARAKKKRN
jgi:PadR family transcriptional regulator AphA